MVEGVGFEIRKVGHAGAGVQIVSSPPGKSTSSEVLFSNGIYIIITFIYHNINEVNFMKKPEPEPSIKKSKSNDTERPISSVYPVIDTDLARDNIENDLSSADLQDL